MKMKVKGFIQALLIVGVIALGYWMYIIFKTPIQFQQELSNRREAVIERLKDIRTAQRSFRAKYGKFAGSFDELINYVQNDSMAIDRQDASEDDSSAMAQGKATIIRSFMMVRDTIFNTRKNKESFKIEDIRYIPYSDVAGGKLAEFEMDTVTFMTESKVLVPVFEAFAPYFTFLGDLDKQELINYRDEQVNTLERADGLMVGSLTAANNEAGNWE